MIFDRTLLFSNAQAITADAASTDYVDLGPVGTAFGHAAALRRDIGKGGNIPLLIQVTEAFNNLTSMKVIVQVDEDPAFGSPKNLQSVELLLADLVPGRGVGITAVPPGASERYMRVFYDITGTAPTTGKVTAGVVADVQTSGVNY